MRGYAVVSQLGARSHQGDVQQYQQTIVARGSVF